MVTEFALEILLKIIKLARSTYYYHLKQLDQTDKNQTIKAEIQAIFTEHKGNYGYRRIHLELRNRGFLVNHKRVQKELNAQTGQMAPMTDKVADTKEFPKTNDGEQSLVSFVGALAILASLMLALRYYIK